MKYCNTVINKYHAGLMQVTAVAYMLIVRGQFGTQIVGGHRYGL